MQSVADATVRLYFDTHDLVQHQLDSYNAFLEHGIHQILTNFPAKKIEHAASNTTHSFQWIDARVERPRIDANTILLPQEARLRNLTYDGHLYTTVRYTLYGGISTKITQDKKKRYESKKSEEEELNQVHDLDQDDQLVKLYSEEYHNVLVCRIPIMVKSSKCHLSDCHGIFFPHQEWPVAYKQVLMSFNPLDHTHASTSCDEEKTRVLQTRVSHPIPASETQHETLPAYLGIELLKKEFIDKLYHGGFFIIKGQEKVVLIQERMRYMHACITLAPKNPRFAKYSHMSEIRSVHESKMKASSTLKLYLSKPAKDGMTCVYADIPYLKSEFMPLPWLFRLMGVTTAQEMESYLVESPDQFDETNKTGNIMNDDNTKRLTRAFLILVKKMCRDFSTVKYDRPSGSHISVHDTEEQNVEWINPDVIYEFYEKVGAKQLHYLTIHEVLPHIGLDDSDTTRHRKLIHLGQQARDLLLIAVKATSVDNREQLIHKRMETTGLLMSLLFRQLVWPECKQIKTQWYNILNDTLEATFDADVYNALHDRAYTASGSTDLDKLNQYIDQFKCPSANVPSLFLRMGITENLRYAIATGNWGKNRGASNSQQGVSQPLNRNSPMSTFSHLRRIAVPLSKDGKLLEPRQYHNSQWGMLCPAETPEGKSCGLIKNLALFAQVNSGIPHSKIQNILDTFAVDELDLTLVDNHSNVLKNLENNLESKKNLVYINGSPTYWIPTNRVRHGIQFLRQLRQRGILPYTVSIYTDKRFTATCVHLNCYTGSMIRPVFNTQKVQQLIVRIKNSTLDMNHVDPILFYFQKLLYLADNVEDTTLLKKSKRVSWTRWSDACSMHAAQACWIYLIETGTIQYLDKNEEAEYQVAKNCHELSIDHVDKSRSDNSLIPHNDLIPSIHRIETIRVQQFESLRFQQPMMELVEWGIWGVMASFIPMLEHNQAVRNIFQCSHGKAAVGISSMNFGQSVHAIHHQLWYPQTPLADTDSERLTGMSQLPTGVNVIVAVMLFDGYNPEDAIVVSKAAVERGLFRSSLFHTYPFEENKNEPHLQFQKNPNTVQLQRQSSNAAALSKRCKNVVNDSMHTESSTCKSIGRLDRIAVNQDRHLDVDGLPIPGCMIKYNDKIFEQVDSRTIQVSDSNIHPENANTAKTGKTIKTKSVVYKGKGSHQHLAQAHSIKRIADDDNLENLTGQRRKALLRGQQNTDFDSNEAASRIDKVIMTNSVHTFAKQHSDDDECQDNDDVVVKNFNNKLKHCDKPRSTYVRLQIMRTPQVGDKLSSRHGQKGVIALMVPQENMPWAVNGIVPDIIINSHYMPSRMTVAQTLELVKSKQASLTGEIQNCTPFVNRDYRQWRQDMHNQGVSDNETLDFLQSVEDSLLTSGYSPSGCEKLYRGDTGQAIEACIFMGPVNYQRLTHQGTDKIHARSLGPTVAIVRQPTDRRSKDGGQRVGEMEKDCLISYGANMITKDRLMDCSDFTPVCVCRKCGMIIASASTSTANERFALKNNRWSKYYDDHNIDLGTFHDAPSSVSNLSRPTFIECPDQNRHAQLQKIYAFQQRTKRIECQTCDDSTEDDLRFVALPQALCCLLNEMMGMNICPKLVLD